VRDLILKETSKDIDIVAVGSGIELALKVSALLLKNQKFRFSKLMVQRCCV
jgi:tRNA nucleotidyltransferase (CCA-adding enzyme)